MPKAMPTPPSIPLITYVTPGPVAKRFLLSDAFVAGIRGPFASGKSVACVMKLLRNVQKQRPGPDGVTRCRIAIIRNTYGELKTTTIKTFHQWIPPGIGHYTDSAPPTHRIQNHKPDGSLAFDLEVWFVALDRPDHVKKLLSMELSFAWINEAREIPKEILDGVTGRVGRYPSKQEGGVVDPQVIMDTNPPDTDHWWPKLGDMADENFLADTEELRKQLVNVGTLRPDQKLYEFFSQPGGLSPQAENIQNLNEGIGYYLRLKAGKSAEWVKIYVNGDYGFVMDGKPVYPEYHDNIHGSTPFQLNRALPIDVGIDFGLTPAAVIGQKGVTGGWRWHGELVTEDMGAMRFGELLKGYIHERYPGFKVRHITGDPAGDTRAQSDETTPFQILRVAGIEARPAPSNDPVIRREAVAAYLNKMIDGQPALMIHPECIKLRKAMSGGYHYRRVQIVGDERYHDQPDKNMHSHIAEAGQYLMLGAGESSVVLRRDPSTRPKRQMFAETDYRTNW